MKYDERACKFNMDTGCVELLLRDGRKISIDCTGIEDVLDVTMAQRSELDYLIYNDPLAYSPRLDKMSSHGNNGLPFSLHGFPAPFRRRFPALLLRVIAGYPMQTVIQFSRFNAGTATKKPPQNRPVMPSLFRKVLPVGYVAT